MRVESREVGIWLVAKKKKSFSIFEEGGSKDEDAYIINDFCIGGSFAAGGAGCLCRPQSVGSHDLW
jgi:hypothetical protein